MIDIFSNFVTLIKSEQEKIAEALTSGSAINIESYQRLVGNYQGLQGALNILDELMTEDNDE